jgi:hypothetical protein
MMPWSLVLEQNCLVRVVLVNFGIYFSSIDEHIVFLYLSCNVQYSERIRINWMRIRILFCHFHADPDPSFQITAENLKKGSNRLIFHLFWLFTFKLMRIRIQLFHFDAGADPDPTFQFDADTDSDPTFQFDPDPQHWTAVRRFRIFFPFSTPCHTRY